MNKRLKDCLIRSAIFILYSALGSVLFWKLEEKDVANSQASKQLLDSIWEDIKANEGNMSRAQFKEFTQRAHRALSLEYKKNWDFFSGCVFVLVTLTTVGYGDLVPETEIGRIVCILYCVIGLPLTMIFLKSLGEAIKIGMTKFLNLCEKHLIRKRLACRTEIKIMVISLIAIWMNICLCSVMTMYTDDYTFLEGLYTWFITFSTIGFGDFVPFAIMDHEVTERKTTREKLVTVEVLSIFPLVFGICMVAAMFSAVLDLITHVKISQMFNRAPSALFSGVFEPVNAAVLSSVTPAVHTTGMRQRSRTGSI